MLYITKTNIDLKTARAKHVRSLIKAAKDFEKRIIFKYRNNRSKSSVIFYLNVIILILKNPNRKIYTRDIDIGLLVLILQRKGCVEFHQFGFLRRNIGVKFYTFKRFILYLILKSTKINAVVLTANSEKFLRRFYKIKTNKLKINKLKK